MENKLTDEEIVKALECCMRNEEENSWAYCAGCPVGGCENEDIVENTDYLVRGAIDLIHRLQDENKRLMARVFDCTAVIEYNEKYSKELQTATILLEHRNKEIDEQKAEIERLKKRHGVALLRNDDLDLENYELKKQVDEWKSNSITKKIMKNENELMNEIKEQCGACEAWSGTDCTRNPYTQGCLKDEKQVIECHGMLKGCDMVKQAVKDTAKEICNLILEYWQGHDLVECDWLRVAISEKYGVEVE